MTTQAIAVHTAFGVYARGKLITDEATVAEIIASPNASKVHRIAMPAVSVPVVSPPTVAQAVADGVRAAEAALHPAA